MLSPSSSSSPFVKGDSSAREENVDNNNKTKTTTNIEMKPFRQQQSSLINEEKANAMRDLASPFSSESKNQNQQVLNLLKREREIVLKQELSDDLFLENRCADNIKEYTSYFSSVDEVVSSSKTFYSEILNRLETHLKNEFLIFVENLYRENIKKRKSLIENAVVSSTTSNLSNILEIIKESNKITLKIESLREDIVSFLEPRNKGISSETCSNPNDDLLRRLKFKNDEVISFSVHQDRNKKRFVEFIKDKVKKVRLENQPREKREKLLSGDFSISLLFNSSSPLLREELSDQEEEILEDVEELEDDKKLNDRSSTSSETSMSSFENKKSHKTNQEDRQKMFSSASSTVTSSFLSSGAPHTTASGAGGGGVTIIKRVSKRGAGAAAGGATGHPNSTSKRFGGGGATTAASATSRFTATEDASSIATGGDNVSLQAKINECRAQFETRSRPLRPFEWGERVRIDKDISKPKSAMTLKKSLLADSFDTNSSTIVRSTIGVFGVQSAIWTIRKDKESCHPFVRFAGEELKAFQFEKALADIEDTFHGGIPLDKYSAPQFDKRFLETHTRLALMESLVTTGGLVNGAKASEMSIAEEIARLFTTASFFDSDKDSHLMSMLFPLISSSRLVPGTSHWDNVGRALLSTFPQKNVYDVNVGIDLWAEMSAQKMLVERLRQWILEKVAGDGGIHSAVEEIVEGVSDRKIISWLLKRTGEGYKTLSSSSSSCDRGVTDGGTTAKFVNDALKIGNSRDDFDILYQPRSGQISKPSEVFKAIANDVFFRRGFGLFAYEMAPDVFQKYSEIGNLTHDFLRFREENFQSFRHEHGRDQARYLDERADLNERGDMSSTLPFRDDNDNEGEDGTSMRKKTSGRPSSSSKMVSEPFCDETVYCDRGITVKQNQGGRAAWHLSEAARVTGERNVYMSASPEDLEWDATKEANCVLMFFESARKGMVEYVENARKQHLSRLSDEFDFVKKMTKSTSAASATVSATMDEMEEFVETIVKMKHQDDINAVVDLYLSSLRDSIFMKKCQERCEEFKKDTQRSITVRTIGGFAREDSSLHNPVYDTWHLKWATSSLSHALEKENRDRMMGKFAARILWQTYVCVPKTDLGSACGASWYKFDEMGHNLRPITGTSEIIDDIVKYIGGIVTPSAETSAVIGDRTLRKHKTLEGNVRLNPIQLETISEGGNRLVEIAKTLTEIKKMINTDRGCKTIIDAMKTEKLIRCEQFNSLKNTDPNLIAFLNGVFDTGGDHPGAVCSFRSGKIEDFITMSTKMAVPYGGMIQPVGMMGSSFLHKKSSSSLKTKTSARSIFYSDDHEDVKFMMNYLSKVFPDEEILSYAIRDMASMLFGANGEKIFRIWSGGGNNSKSILVKILQYGFGDYCFDLPAESICSKQIRNPSGPSPELAQGEGTRIGVMTEPADGVELDSGIIKRFTGGDRIHVRKLHENGGSIVASYKLILCCNDPPHLSQIDTATKNRVVILPFVSTWVDNPPQTDEAQMASRRFKIDPSFQAQAPRLARALMWKLIHSYADYKKVGIMERPKIMQEYVDTFWKTVDKYHSFKEQFVDEAPGETLAAQDLYNVFAPWDLSQNPGSRAVGYGKFKQNMCRKDHLGPTSSLAGGKEGWNGFRIKISSSSNSPPSPTPSTIEHVSDETCSIKCI